MKSELSTFIRWEVKHEQAYRRRVFRPMVPAGTGMKLFHRAIIEAIVEEKTDRWRDELARGTDPYEIHTTIGIRAPLPPDKGRPKRKNDPIFYWGT
jgi:hypothetical protein